jgi:hypothetical protein
MHRGHPGYALAEMVPPVRQNGDSHTALVQKVENGFIVTVQYPKKLDLSGEQAEKLRVMVPNEDERKLLEGYTEMVEEIHVAKTWEEALGIMTPIMNP